MKYKGIHISLIIALFDSFTLVKCGLSMNHLPAILQEFKINHPAIADTILHKKETIKLLKILSVNLLRQTDDINNQFQSYLIFCKINEFTWTFRSDSRILIVTEIQNETDLNQVEVPIGNEILIVRSKNVRSIFLSF